MTKEEVKKHFDTLVYKYKVMGITFDEFRIDNEPIQDKTFAKAVLYIDDDVYLEAQADTKSDYLYCWELKSLSLDRTALVRAAWTIKNAVESFNKLNEEVEAVKRSRVSFGQDLLKVLNVDVEVKLNTEKKG